MVESNQQFTYQTEQGKQFIESWYQSVLKKWPVPLSEHRIDTTYGPTFVIECGQNDRPTLILLHGLGLNSGQWRTGVNIEDLADKFHLLLVDVIGDAGRSIINEKPTDPEFYADWIAQIFAHFQIDNALIAGTSFGGALALMIAYKRPDLVRKAVAIVPPAIVCRVSMSAMARMMFVGLFINEKRLIKFLKYVNGGTIKLDKYQELIDFMLGVGKAKNRFAVAQLPTFNDQQLKSVSAPCVCFMAGKDPFYRADKVKTRLDSLGCHVKAEVVPECGHLMGQDFTPYILRGIAS